jgi:hypothetical protein
MAKFQEGDRVFVPAALLPDNVESPGAMYRTTVVDTVRRSVKVGIPGEKTSGCIPSSKVRELLGILIIRIGNYHSDYSLLDPLAKSLLQYCRLLMTDDFVWLREIRSLAELQMVWQEKACVTSHVLLVGHGNGTAMQFAVDGWADARAIMAALEKAEVGPTAPKLLISLCCKSGYKAFSSPLSECSAFHSVVSPFHSVHGAIASQFCQTYLAQEMIEGVTTKVAFNRASQAVAGKTIFRLWQGGKLVAGPKG